MHSACSVKPFYQVLLLFFQVWITSTMDLQRITLAEGSHFGSWLRRTQPYIGRPSGFLVQFMEVKNTIKQNQLKNIFNQKLMSHAWTPSLMGCPFQFLRYCYFSFFVRLKICLTYCIYFYFYFQDISFSVLCSLQVLRHTRAMNEEDKTIN